jgi:hypothetical protein
VPAVIVKLFPTFILSSSLFVLQVLPEYPVTKAELITILVDGIASDK